MNKHTVYVAGKRFVLLSEDSDKYVQKLADEVNQAINKISDNNPRLESRSCAILCALDYADDKYKEKEKTKRINSQAKKVIEQSDKHAKQIKEMKEQISDKESTIEQLQEKVADLEKKLQAQQQENKTTQQDVKTEPKEAESNKNTQNITQTPEIKTAKKKEKKHSHPHVNQYREKAIENKTDNTNKGYTPVRQFSLFEDEKN